MPSYRVLIPLRYPVGPSLDRVRKAGGLSRLSADERASVVMVERQAGVIVSDVPSESVRWLIDQGYLAEMTEVRADG